MDIYVPQGDRYLYGDDTYIEEGNDHSRLIYHLQKYMPYRKILTRYGDPFIRVDFPNYLIEGETDYTGTWKVTVYPNPKIKLKDRYTDKEFIELIDKLFEGEI